MKRNFSSIAVIAICILGIVCLFPGCDGTDSLKGGPDQQTNAMTVRLKVTLETPLLDYNMVPVTLQGKQIWAMYEAKDYKEAVEANAAIIANKVVLAEIHQTWTLSGYKYVITNTRIVSVEAYNDPCNRENPHFSEKVCDSMIRARLDSVNCPKKANPCGQAHPCKPCCHTKGGVVHNTYVPNRPPVCIPSHDGKGGDVNIFVNGANAQATITINQSPCADNANGQKNQIPTVDLTPAKPGSDKKSPKD